MTEEKRPKQRAGLGSVKPRGTKWRASIMLDGERHTWTVDSEQEGHDRIADARRRHAQGLRAKQRPETVRELLARYLASREGLAPTTVTRYERDMRLYLLPRLGTRQVTSLTVADVEALMAALKRQGLSPRSVVMVRNTLRQALNWAMRDNDVIRNVAARADPPPQEPRQAIILSRPQRDALLGAVAGHRFAPAYLLALALGLREGEILGLRWRDVDFTAATLTIAQQVINDGGRTVIRPRPKTAGSAATLPIPPAVADALRGHRARQAEARLRADRWDDHGLVFPSRVGTPVNPRNFYRHFQTVRAILARDDPEWAAIHFHDLRSSAATYLAAMGVPIALVQRILRHQSSRTTERHYVRLSHEDVRAALEGLWEVLGEGEAKNGG